MLRARLLVSALLLLPVLPHAEAAPPLMGVDTSVYQHDGGRAIDWNAVVFNMLTIKGIYGREMYETWYKMTAMIQSGLDISPVITHRFHFTEFQTGFDLMRSGRSGKIVLSWS